VPHAEEQVRDRAVHEADVAEVKGEFADGGGQVAGGRLDDSAGPDVDVGVDRQPC
jgi:hypothetical protein